MKGIQLDEIEGLRKKTETELKLTTIIPTNRNINTSWNKDVSEQARRFNANSNFYSYSVDRYGTKSYNKSKFK